MKEDVVDAEARSEGVSSIERRGSAAALTVNQQRAIEPMGGAAAKFPLAMLSDSEFAGVLDLMKRQVERMKDVQRGLMKAGIHYGIPGKKPAEVAEAIKQDGAKVGLYKPGMEMLLKFHDYVADVKQTIHYGDPANVTSPAIRVESLSFIHAGSLNGPIIAVGVGSANSWETKHRYRHAPMLCPECKQPFLRFQKDPKFGDFKGKPSYWCAPGKNGAPGGCGMNFSDQDPRIEKDTGKVANGEAYDLENTLVKMSAKRAKVDGTITATGASDLFTQDLEDLPKGVKFNPAPDSEIDASLDSMYGGGAEDPDAWRQEVTTATGTPKPAAATPPAQNHPPAAEGEPLASQSQRNLIGLRLKAKFGATNAATQDSVLSNQLGFPGGIQSITKAQAGQLITKLNGMPDHVGGVAAAAPPNPSSDDIATREKYAAGVKAIAAQLTEANANRVILSTIEGLVYVVGSNEQAVLGFTGPVQLDTLTVEQLIKLGTYLRQEQTKAQAA